MTTIPSVKFKRSEAHMIADRMIHRLMKGETLSGFSDDQLYLILEAAKRVLTPLPVMIEMAAPLVIFGDVHGQFTDLLRFFKIVGTPPDVKMLFLGDYVDRCNMSLEIIMLLFSFKIRFPDRIELLRGNHECSKMNRIYGFYEELRRKRTVKMWRVFQEVFNELPLCALVSKRILTMHGGISPHIDNWETLHKLKKPKTVKECDEGVPLDLMWSDPTKDTCGFLPNKTRAASYVFGDDSIKQFCYKMNIDLIVRAHELTMEGHEMLSDNLLCTLFSAPNYCGTDRNSGSVMKVSVNLEISFHTLRPRINTRNLTEDKMRILEKQAGLDPSAKSPNPLVAHHKSNDGHTTQESTVAAPPVAPVAAPSTASTTVSITVPAATPPPVPTSAPPTTGDSITKTQTNPPTASSEMKTDKTAGSSESPSKSDDAAKKEEKKSAEGVRLVKDAAPPSDEKVPSTSGSSEHPIAELTASKEDVGPLWIGTPTPEQKAAFELEMAEKKKKEEEAKRKKKEEEEEKK